MRLILPVAVVIGVGCLAGETLVLAKGGPAAAASLGERLAAAVKALADTKPTPVEATKVKGSKSNSSERIEGLVEGPVLLATTVKGSKSNSSDRSGGGIKATATYVKAVDKSSPILIRVAKGEVEEAPAGTLTIDRDLVLPAATPIALSAGIYTVALLDAKHHVQPGRTEAIVTVRGWDPQKRLVGAIFVDAAALALWMTTPPDQQQSADFYANAVILNLLASMLEEAAAEPSLADALVAAVKAITATNPTPVEATNLNSSKSNIYKTGGPVDQPVALATKVKGSKSNTSERDGGLKATATQVGGGKAMLERMRSEAGESPVGSLTIDRALVLRASTPVTLAAGTYRVSLLDAKHHKQPGRTAWIIEIKGPDGTTVGGIDVDAEALAHEATHTVQQKFADVWPNAVVLNLLVSLLEESAGGR